VIRPRLDALYAWSDDELSIPQRGGLVQDGVPAFANDIIDADLWNPTPKIAEHRVDLLGRGATDGQLGPYGHAKPTMYRSWTRGKRVHSVGHVLPRKCVPQRDLAW